MLINTNLKKNRRLKPIKYKQADRNYAIRYKYYYDKLYVETYVRDPIKEHSVENITLTFE